MKESVDRVDADLHAAANKIREELLIMMYLGYIGMAYVGGIRTGPIISILDKVTQAVACEVEAETTTLSIEQIKDRIQNFKQQKIWTPYFASLILLEEWYKKIKDVSQKVISKVTRIRLIYRSKLVNKMIGSSDFDIKVNSESCEIVIKRSEKDRGMLTNRSKREKRKNPLIGNGMGLGLIDGKPVKQNKDLIEEIDFNDYAEKVELMCFCNRRKPVYSS